MKNEINGALSEVLVPQYKRRLRKLIGQTNIWVIPLHRFVSALSPYNLNPKIFDTLPTIQYIMPSLVLDGF